MKPFNYHIIFFLTLFLSAHLYAQQIINTNIEMSDGVMLDATIVSPFDPPPPNGYPAAVLVHGFGGSKIDMLPLALIISTYGYASLSYSVRGQGNSGGLSTINGPREIQDLYEVIEFLRNFEDIDSTNLGVAGGSQGGIHAWMAAIYHMPGIKSIVTLIGPPNFARSLVPNNCVSFGLPYELTQSSVNYSSDRDRGRDFIISDMYDSLLVYIDERDLEHLVDSVNIPVFQELGWADFQFPVNGGITARENLYQRGVPVWSYYGTNGHGEPYDTTQYAIILQTALNWFDHWLRGAPLAQDSVPLVFYADDSPGWPIHTTLTWPPDQTKTLRLYFTKEGLSTSLPADTASFPFSIDYDTSYSPQTAWDDLYGGEQFVNAFNNHPLVLISSTLDEDMEVTGTPEGFIKVQSDAEKFQAHVRLYDVDDTGDEAGWKFMSRSVNGIRGNLPGTVNEVNFENHSLSHIIPAGHKIAIEITSLDMYDSIQANTIPYFLSANSLLLTSASSPSFIDIPFIGSSPQFVSNDINYNPEGFNLQQNFPNPFNPTTKIKFTISPTVIASGVKQSILITLKIYDILGREAATLVNEDKPAGSYVAEFNAAGLASGIYFYQLKAGKFVDTKKMILLK